MTTPIAAPFRRGRRSTGRLPAPDEHRPLHALQLLQRLAPALGAALALAASASGPAHAQSSEGPSIDQEQTFEEAVEVRVVEVETWVEDRKGNPVSGLGRDDFELIVDGQVRPIEYFDSASGWLTPATRTEQSRELEVRDRKPSFLAIYVDRHFLEKGDLAKVKAELSDFLTQGLHPEDQVLLATANEQLEVLESFTPNRQQVLRKLRRLEGAPDGGKLAGDFRALMREMRAEQSARQLPGAASLGTAVRPQRMRKQSPEGYLAEIEMVYRESAGEMRFVAGQLLELIGTLSGLPGNKQVLYVGGPIPTDDAKLLFEVWRDVFERSQRQDDSIVTNEEVYRVQRLALRALARNRDFRLGVDMFREVATAASVSGVTFHTLGLASLRRSRNVMASRADVEVGSIGSGNSPDGLTDTRASLAMDDGMQTLSILTGGRHLVGRRKFDVFFENLGKDLRSRYVLGFTGSPEAGSEPRKVKVRLTDRGNRLRHVVRHRESFMIKTREVELAERTLAALMVDEPPAGELDVQLAVRVPQARVEGWVLEVTVRVPTSQLVLVPDRETHLGQLSIFATAGQLGSDFAPVMKAKLPLRFASADVELARERPLQYVFELRTPRDPGRLAVTVRDELGPTEATVTADVAAVPELVEEPTHRPPAKEGDEAEGR
ncbi:MAG: VWA domain-containing protein [Holophagales bacterium]|nr:VWA domain-containing protein [Holophagales bacterium]